MQHGFWKKVMACVLSLVLCVSCTIAFAEDETIELTYWAHSGTKEFRCAPEPPPTWRSIPT